MIRGFDHIVIPVGDLDSAIADYSKLGFSVVRGGRHSRLNTHNALIAFADGCYFELIAFLGPPAVGAHWWYEALQRGGGLTDFCLQSNDLEDDVAVFRRAGAVISAPFAMSRERPDGYRISWELAVCEDERRGLVPFFIRDVTPRDERVPASYTHSNGTTGVRSLTLVIAELNSIRSIYETALLQPGERIKRDDLQADGVRFGLGLHEIQLVVPRSSTGPAAERLRVRGPSPLEATLSGGTSGLLDPSRAHGARIVRE
jgi:catechol 2,3-dioxygenase-like lactoylglutathione lyase family enzyme